MEDRLLQDAADDGANHPPRVGRVHRLLDDRAIGLLDDLPSALQPREERVQVGDVHAQGYTLQGRSSGEKPIDATDWSPSEAWTAGEMISTVDDLLVYGRALGTGKGLLSPEQESGPLDSLVSDVP